ncbi:TetR/AcrR family transcriptional regulator C-terminal domain-containing protein [Streptosporangium sp. NBC_01469]|uniref:TetR/AcrR family transcriptional regulator C-terminal domain-containing protein n=1 Tax=Streptosporangium sp. NBC_01469 TaxID=2903898 RepID=UPI002E2A9465|nr:TetR/AcrR family transcriptional regulator C-terminal domain-containing protein [Streptosporangium sp. NBC_01469]
MRHTRATVMRTALRLLNEVGLDGLTTRRLAQELDVQSPALYRHFGSKQELLDHMAATMVEDAFAHLARPGPDQDWADWLAERGRALRRSLLTHRDGARLHVGTRPVGSQIAISNSVVEVLGEAGFPPADARRADLVISRYTVGWAVEEQAGAGRPVTEESRDAADADFEYGLRTILAGLRASLGETR